MSPSYILERWPHGWLICSAPGVGGVPLDALTDCGRLFGKDAVICNDIAHHYRTAGRGVVFAVAGRRDAEAWRKEIATALAPLCPEERWWRGMGVGMSSASIFAALCPHPHLAQAAMEYGRGATPADADDLGRCLRLLEQFPSYRSRLRDVAVAYPETHWPTIIERWAELESALPAEQSRILGEIAGR